MSSKPTSEIGSAVSMLIDESGKLKPNYINLIGSYLYRSEIHKDVIVGNILIIGEVYRDMGIDFCGLKDADLKSLLENIENLRETFRRSIKEQEIRK